MQLKGQMQPIKVLHLAHWAISEPRNMQVWLVVGMAYHRVRCPGIPADTANDGRRVSKGYVTQLLVS